MEVSRNCSTYRFAIRLSIPVLVLLLYAPFISNSTMYVLCLEGRGQITVERQHYKGTNLFMDNSKQANRSPFPYNNKCNNTNHIILADISSAEETCFYIDLEPSQIQQDVLQPPTEYVFKEHIPFVLFRNHPSTANQQITTIHSTVLLI